MLEKIVKKLSGVVLGGVIVLLSAVFILQFGNQSQGCGATPSAQQVAKVYGKPIYEADLRAAFVLAGGDRVPAERARQMNFKDNVLKGLVEEALLAHEARELGFQVTEDDVMTQVAEDSVVYVPMSVSAGPFLPPAGAIRLDFTDENGSFSKDNLKRFIQGGLQRSVRDFAESQISGTLADRMRKTVASGVAVGSGEVWDAFVREKESAVLKYARFSPVYYAQQLKPSEAELSAWMSAHTDAVDAEYEKQKHRYTGLEKQVRARHILIKVNSDASDEDKAAARARAEKLLAEAKAGADFAELARENSEDTGSAKKGGDLGFNPKGRMVAPFDEAQFSMAPGDISDIVESSFGLHIIKVEAVREGDVPVEEAKRELADKLFRDERAGELAKQAAEAALAKLKAGTSIEDLETEWTPTAPQGETSSDTAPARDPLAPQFRDTRPFGRSEGPIPGAFDSTPLAKAAYDMDTDAPLPGAPMKLGDDYFVYRLEEKTLAKRDDFTAEEQERIRDGLLQTRRRDAVVNYVRLLRKRAEQANALQEDAAFLSDGAGAS